MTIAMRPSKVLRKLRAGETVNCFKSNLTCHRVADIVGMMGYDCIWPDLEHVANDYAVVERQILAAKIHDMDVVVRVPRGSYSDLIRPLELDATGIMVPHIMSAADARAIARQTRFHPVGRRPVDGGNADGGYCNVDFKEYLRTANRERFVIVQIEDPEPMAELDAICAVEGIDMIFFGPGDFSHGIGAPGDWDDPRIDEARRRVAACALAHGKFAGTPGSPDTIPELMAMGYRFFSCGADVTALSAFCRDMLTRFQTAVASAAPVP